MSIPKNTKFGCPISLNKYEIKKKTTEICLWRFFWHWDTLDEDDFNDLFFLIWEYLEGRYGSI